MKNDDGWLLCSVTDRAVPQTHNVAQTSEHRDPWWLRTETQRGHADKHWCQETRGPSGRQSTHSHQTYQYLNNILNTLQLEIIKIPANNTMLNMSVWKLTWKSWIWSRMMLIIEISGGVWHLESVQHCLSAVMREWSFMDCVFMTFNVMMLKNYYMSIYMSIYLKGSKKYLVIFNIQKTFKENEQKNTKFMYY